MIKVLIAEDSPVVREFLVHILGSDPDIRVVGTANDGEEALEAVKRYRPDVITMDIHMPKMDGLEATRRIMETCPTPIVVVSGSTDPHENTMTFRAMEAGALAVLKRPAGIGHPDYEDNAMELVQTVKLIASFVEWLAQSAGLPIHVAIHGEYLVPGHAYVAPDEFQMKVERGGRIALTRDEPESGLRPSVSYLFRSLAEVYGGNVAAGLLTGMGRDGAAELRLLREKGAVTFAQDKESSVVHGMPGEAIRLDAAVLILAPDKIAAVLVNLARNKNNKE